MIYIIKQQKSPRISSTAVNVLVSNST